MISYIVRFWHWVLWLLGSKYFMYFASIWAIIYTGLGAYAILFEQNIGLGIIRILLGTVILLLFWEDNARSMGQ